LARRDLSGGAIKITTLFGIREAGPCIPLSISPCKDAAGISNCRVEVEECYSEYTKQSPELEFGMGLMAIARCCRSAQSNCLFKGPALGYVEIRGQGRAGRVDGNTLNGAAYVPPTAPQLIGTPRVEELQGLRNHTDVTREGNTPAIPYRFPCRQWQILGPINTRHHITK